MAEKAFVVVTPWALTFALLAALILRAFIIMVYRWQFHPLSRFPGPFFAKISDIYTAYHSFRGDNHITILRAHETYGPMVRMGPNKLSVNSVSALHQVYGQSYVKKSKGYETMLPAPGAYNTHTCIDKDLHRHKRRVMGQAFSERALRDFEPTIIKETNIFLHQLHQNAGKDGWSDPVNMSQIVRYMTIDVLGAFAFGRSFDLQTQEKNRFLLKAINAASRVSGIYAQYPRLKSSVLERIIKQRGAWTRAQFGNLVLELVKQRISEKEDACHDLFSFIINAKDPETGKGFELNEIWAESRLLIIAGSDTTATAICTTLFYLSRYPDCKSKLIEEIESKFAAAEEIKNGPQLSSCHYLRGCIDEAMRMTPPIGTALWREVCESGLSIDGIYIPPGVDVGSSLYSIHHLESIFPDSWTYIPERWLREGDPSDESRLADQKRAFNPFSLGTRKCIAPTLAYTEASIALARLLWFFDFRRPDGELDRVGEGVAGDRNGRHRPKEFQLQEHLTSVHEGPYLQFQYREHLRKQSA